MHKAFQSDRTLWIAGLVVGLFTVGAVSSAYADAEARLPDDSSLAVQPHSGRNLKLTLGRYHYGSEGQGTDLNLRYRRGELTGWVGFYDDRSYGQQWRAGLERAVTLVDGVPLSLQVSVQAASRSFFGGSLTLEYGEPWFVLGGMGRTNQRSYFNLNFDPNDAWTIGAGWRAPSGMTAYLLTVRDNRSNPGQQHVHWVMRLPLSDRRRLIVDLLHKQDPAIESGRAGRGLTLTWEWRDWSLRLASDRRQNFSDTNATRLSVAYRF